MNQSVWNELKGKKKSEWNNWARSKLTELRIWVQEHGEASLGLGVLTGIFFVLFFKLFIGLLVLLGLVGLVIWQFAPEDEVEKVDSNEPVEENSNSQNPDLQK